MTSASLPCATCGHALGTTPEGNHYCLREDCPSQGWDIAYTWLGDSGVATVRDQPHLVMVLMVSDSLKTAREKSREFGLYPRVFRVRYSKVNDGYSRSRSVYGVSGYLKLLEEIP